MTSLIDIGVEVRNLIEDVTMNTLSLKKLTKSTIEQIEGLKTEIVDEEALSLKKKSDMEGDDWSFESFE